jgi:hypothetical protein
MNSKTWYLGEHKTKELVLVQRFYDMQRAKDSLSKNKCSFVDVSKNKTAPTQGKPSYHISRPHFPNPDSETQTRRIFKFPSNLLSLRQFFAQKTQRKQNYISWEIPLPDFISTLSTFPYLTNNRSISEDRASYSKLPQKTGLTATIVKASDQKDPQPSDLQEQTKQEKGRRRQQRISST